MKTIIKTALTIWILSSLGACATTAAALQGFGQGAMQASNTPSATQTMHCTDNGFGYQTCTTY